MKRSHLALAAALVLMGTAAGTARAATLCVDHRPGCFDELQPAVDAAHDGDTIRIAPGVYRGGVRIDVSVEVRGAGAKRTRIRGGGPVLTIGTPLAADPPTVAISDLTISGGRTTSSEQAFLAFGGGVYIPPSADDEPGATVTIDRTVIAHNRAAPGAASPAGFPECPECPLALARGGGIFNAGNLTLTRTTVTRNRAAGPVTTFSQGGGIYSNGPLTVDRSAVIANDADSQPPNGRGAEGAGIWANETGLTIRHSTISANRAVLESHSPSGDSPAAIGAGVFVECIHTDSGCDFQRHGGVQVTIEHSTIDGNEARASNPIGDAIAFSAGVHGNGAVAISDSVVGHNRAVATIPPGSSAKADADSAAGNLNVGALIEHVQFAGNSVFALAPDGTAVAAAGSIFAFTDDTLDVRDSSFTHNRVTAMGHQVDAAGAGIVNVDALTLRETDVSRNTLHAIGATGDARGGGIFNGRRPGSEDFTPALSVFDSTITGNAITASPQVNVSGGGLFTNEPVTLEHVLISGNRPDDTAAAHADRAAIHSTVRRAIAPRAQRSPESARVAPTWAPSTAAPTEPVASHETPHNRRQAAPLRQTVSVRASSRSGNLERRAGSRSSFATRRACRWRFPFSHTERNEPGSHHGGGGSQRSCLEDARI